MVPQSKLVQNWDDIGFTALPHGWINVWKLDDGTHFTEPCPGVLLQECTTARRCWTEENADGSPRFRSRSEVQERETRTVFAYREEGVSYLQPVDESGSYVMTTTVDEWSARQEAR